MKLFIDTANLVDIEAALKRGFARGITTNPSLLAKEPKGNFADHVGKIIGLIREYQPGAHLSVEVFSRDADVIFEQALDFHRRFSYDNLSVKVQIGWDELEVIRRLKAKDIAVNCTACMSVTQAVMAASAGARYVSLFWGRIRDGGLSAVRAGGIDRGVWDDHDFDPAKVVRSARSLIDASYPGVEIIVGSIRSVVDVRDAGLSGAHIVTVPPKFFPDMINHFKTDEIVDQFLKDFREWLT